MHDRTMSEEDRFDVIYRRYARRLDRAVTLGVTAPRPVIEEACQAAWGRLLSADPPVSEAAALRWLTITAIREVWRATRAQRRELALATEATDGGTVIELRAREPGPERVAELREQLAEIAQLPSRQRRMVWLQGLGYDYGEIAAQTGASRRTVERQLRRARRTLNDLVA